MVTKLTWFSICRAVCGGERFGSAGVDVPLRPLQIKLRHINYVIDHYLISSSDASQVVDIFVHGDLVAKRDGDWSSSMTRDGEFRNETNSFFDEEFKSFFFSSSSDLF